MDADVKRMRTAANDALYWIVEIMRGSNGDTRYTQRVMEKAREHIQRLGLMLHGSAEGVDACNRTQELVDAAKAVIERWESPLWKNLPHTGEYIHRLRQAVDAAVMDGSHYLGRYPEPGEVTVTDKPADGAPTPQEE
jgi:hypothetical protein